MRDFYISKGCEYLFCYISCSAALQMFSLLDILFLIPRQHERRPCWFSSGFKRSSQSSTQWGCLFTHTMVHFLWSWHPKKLDTQPLPCCFHSLNTLIVATALVFGPRQEFRTKAGFFLHMNNDVTESEEKWRASGRSSRSIWILLGAKPFACAKHRAFCMVGMTTSKLMAQPGPLCRSLSVRGLHTQLQACAIWGPIFDRLHAEQGSVEPSERLILSAGRRTRGSLAESVFIHVRLHAVF